MAKVRVEIYLLKTLHTSVFVGAEDENIPLSDYVKKIEWENVPKYCKHYRKIGHSLINYEGNQEENWQVPNTKRNRKKKAHKTAKEKQNENKKEIAQKNVVRTNDAHDNNISQPPIEVQKEEPSIAYAQNMKEGRKKKKKIMPQKKSSVMFKHVKKNRKNTSKNATGGKTVATNAVIEDSLKELGVMENNKSMNIVNTQKVTSNAKSDTIEKVDESNPFEDSLPSEIKKHPGIQVVVNFGGYNIEEKRIQDHGKMIEEGTVNSNMSMSDNSDETLNKQPDDPAEAHLKEISNRHGISPVKRGRSRNRKIEKKNKEKMNLFSRGRSQS
ncbi:uncharacterized protein [Nicotiana tomentosiformis]|uniref:uncharacterized protein n=1 Tax=Nicotiana tomentosiformis TaxID=4098 RepID=UPI00388CB111